MLFLIVGIIIEIYEGALLGALLMIFEGDIVSYFILDCYNKFDKNKNVRKIFVINNNLYCIREVVATEFEWGNPVNVKFPERDWEDTSNSTYHYFTSYEEAEAQVHLMVGALP